MEGKGPLEAGLKAPDFLLHDTPDQRVRLADLRGRPVVLLFYPYDFSPICSNELSVFNEVLPEFQRRGAVVMGISVDSVWSHLAFARDINLRFPLLSDFHPKGAAASLYRAYREEDGETERAVYVVDGQGRIAWGHISPHGVNVGTDGALRALESLGSEPTVPDRV